MSTPYASTLFGRTAGAALLLAGLAFVPVAASPDAAADEAPEAAEFDPAAAVWVPPAPTTLLGLEDPSAEDIGPVSAELDAVRACPIPVADTVSSDNWRVRKQKSRLNPDVKVHGTWIPLSSGSGVWVGVNEDQCGELPVNVEFPKAAVAELRSVISSSYSVGRILTNRERWRRGHDAAVEKLWSTCTTDPLHLDTLVLEDLTDREGVRQAQRDTAALSEAVDAGLQACTDLRAAIGPDSEAVVRYGVLVHPDGSRDQAELERYARMRVVADANAAALTTASASVRGLAQTAAALGRVVDAWETCDALEGDATYALTLVGRMSGVVLRFQPVATLQHDHIEICREAVASVEAQQELISTHEPIRAMLDTASLKAKIQAWTRARPSAKARVVQRARGRMAKLNALSQRQLQPLPGMSRAKSDTFLALSKLSRREQDSALLAVRSGRARPPTAKVKGAMPYGVYVSGSYPVLTRRGVVKKDMMGMVAIPDPKTREVSYPYSVQWDMYAAPDVSYFAQRIGEAQAEKAQGKAVSGGRLPTEKDVITAVLCSSLAARVKELSKRSPNPFTEAMGVEAGTRLRVRSSPREELPLSCLVSVK